MQKVFSYLVMSICILGSGFSEISSARGDIVFSDGIFLDSDWSLISIGFGGGTTSVHQVSTGGNSGEFRSITTTMTTEKTCATAYCFKNSAVYNPSLQGPIISIDYSEDSKLINGFGNGQSTGMALMQNGLLYYRWCWTTPYSTWHHNVASPSGDADMFILDALIDNGTQPYHPDFSSSGSDITFGFFRNDNNGSGGHAYSIEAGIDNWNVTLHTVPEPGSLSLVAIGATALLMRGRKWQNRGL